MEEECQKVLDSWNEDISKEAHISKGPPYCKEGNIPTRVVMIITPIGDHIGIKDPLKEEGIQVRAEGHLNEEDILIGMEGLLEEEDTLKEKGILEEDPLMVEDPLMMDP